MTAAIPQSIICEEITFRRRYRDGSNARWEQVRGIAFGLDFPDFATFHDQSRLQPRWIIIHRPSGKSVSETMHMERIPPFLESIRALIDWSRVESVKRHSELFQWVSKAARQMGIENL